jgi:hypothetical protein
VTNFIEGADDIYSQGYIKGDDWGSKHIWGPWEEEEANLQWINEWEDLRSTVEGAGNLSRFDYWLHTLKAYKLMAEFSSTMNQYEAMTIAGNLEIVSKHRSRLARLWEQIMSELLQRVHDEVDLGVILNLDWRTWRNWIVGKYDHNFIHAGGVLPDDHQPSQTYTGNGYITCMPILTHVQPGEEITIKALIMGDTDGPVLHYRKLGTKSFSSIKMEHDARGVYVGKIPGQKEDIEWYVTDDTSLGDVIFPASAGASGPEKMYQTVVVCETKR